MAHRAKYVTGEEEIRHAIIPNYMDSEIEDIDNNDNNPSDDEEDVLETDPNPDEAQYLSANSGDFEVPGEILIGKDGTEWVSTPYERTITCNIRGSVDKVNLPSGKHIYSPVDVFLLFSTWLLILL